MKLISYGPHAAPGALLRSGDILDLRAAALPGSIEAWLPASAQAILQGGPDGLAVARRIADRVEEAAPAQREQLRAQGALLSADGVQLHSPVGQPRLLLAAGLAFKSHLAEMSGTATPPHPTAFLKSPHSVTGCGPVVLPRDAATQVDYEGEVAFVFGQRCHQVSAKDALRYIAGCTAANDLSARDWVGAVWNAKEAWPARLSWEVNIMGKQFPGFTPLGPALLTMDEIQSHKDLQITTRLNGRQMQSAALSDMIFDIAENIAYFSRWYEFQPGDVLLTGTPAGVGVGRKPPVFLAEGDRIEVELSGVGTLRNTVRLA
jgi:2-keto-4-pentenoate hydratase/2-oxohepta-3-ene-1,7-dioic acid hydratase in catechol pathway